MACILLVEPASIVREPLSVVLRQHGHEVSAATTGREALALLSARVPGLILTELVLPDMDGIEFLRQVRLSRASGATRILVMSSVTDRDLIRQAVSFMVAGYVIKQGFSLSALLQRITLLTSTTAAPTVTGALQVSAKPAAPAPAKAATEPTPATDPDDDDSETQAEALARLKPIVGESDVSDGLNKMSEVKALSPSLGHLMKLTARADCGVDMIVEAVKMDHAVAVKILKLANSSVFTRGEPVDSIKKAVLRIGSTEIRQAVMNIAVIDRFSSPEMNRLLDCNQFWEHAIATGVIASEIARSLRRKDVDVAFTMGLLHDVGRMILAEQLGERYVHVARTALELGLPLDMVEKRMLRTNHADIMEQVLQKWNFPRQLVQPIVHHHLSAGSMRKAASRELAECGIVALANCLAQSLMLGSSGGLTISPGTDYAEMLGIDPAAISRIVEEAPEQTNNIKFAMLSTSNIDAWPQLREENRAAIGGEFRPLYASVRGTVDAVAVFVGRLASNHSEEGPNIGVVRIPSPREVIAVTRDFLEAEAKAEAKMLPLILISPTGKIGLEESAMRGRATRYLTTPFSAGRFINRARALLPAAPPMAAAA